MYCHLSISNPHLWLIASDEDYSWLEGIQGDERLYPLKPKNPI